MKKLSVFLILLAFIGLSMNVAYADDVNTLKTKIEAFNHGGTGTLSASVSGNTVTVTGNVSGATKHLSLKIDAAVTVLWKATYEGSTSNGNGMFNLYGSGTFEVAGGIITQNENGEINPTPAISASDYPITIKVSGGMIRAEEGYAIHNTTGTVTISGGIGFAYGTAVTDVINGPFTVPSVNSAVLVAWNKAAGNTTYTAGTSDDILVIPTTITAVWANQEGNAGILGTLGSITGFIPIEGVTITGLNTFTITASVEKKHKKQHREHGENTENHRG